MTYHANALKAMFNALARDTYTRAKAWFQEHPEEPYCYWSKDEFILIKDKHNKAILDKHPEIENIDDHTTVYFEANVLTLRTFCPKLRAGIRELVSSGFTGNTTHGIQYEISTEGDNFRIDAYEEV